MREAFASMASNTGSSFPRELLMILTTLQLRLLFTRQGELLGGSIFAFLRAAKDLRRSTAFGALRR